MCRILNRWRPTAMRGFLRRVLLIGDILVTLEQVDSSPVKMSTGRSHSVRPTKQPQELMVSRTAVAQLMWLSVFLWTGQVELEFRCEMRILISQYENVWSRHEASAAAPVQTTLIPDLPFFVSREGPASQVVWSPCYAVIVSVSRRDFRERREADPCGQHGSRTRWRHVLEWRDVRTRLIYGRWLLLGHHHPWRGV